MRKNLLTRRMLPLVPLMLLLNACGFSSQPSPQPYAIPPLPAEARQPTAERMPSICSRGCSAGLTTLRGDLRNSLTLPTSQDLPASAATMH